MTECLSRVQPGREEWRYQTAAFSEIKGRAMVWAASVGIGQGCEFFDEKIAIHLRIAPLAGKKFVRTFPGGRSPRYTHLH